MSGELNYITEETFAKMKEELNQLKTVGRAEIAKAIAEAREKGDLKENAEYDAAKEAQGLHEAKIAKLEQVIITARIIDTSKIDTSKVAILSKVKLKNIKMKKEIEYQIVSESEANLKEGKISVKSPIAAALLGKAKGDVVDVQTPGGLMQFEILDINI